MMKRHTQLPAAIIMLGWISFFTDIASEMLYPVVPLFLTATLGAPVVVLGVIEGVAEAIVSIMKGLSGWYTDRCGRRVPSIRWGYGLAAFSKLLMAMAFSWPSVFLARCVDRFGKGLRTTARDALIADAVDASHGGSAYGFHRMMDTAGAIVGVLIALGLLAWLPHQYRTIFFIATVPGVAAVAITFKLREGRQQDNAPRTSAPRQKHPWTAFSKGYWLTLSLLVLFAFANSSDALLILRAKNLGLSDIQAILGYTLFNCVYALSAYPFGMLSDRIGRWPMVISGWIIYSFVYFGFAYASTWGIWILFPIYGLFMGLTDGVGKALIRDKISEEYKGTGLGIFHMAIGFAALAGSSLAGFLWDAIDPRAPFILGGCVSLLAVFIFFLALHHVDTPKKAA